MIKVCLDPGHCAGDPGAVNGTRYEKNDVLRLALAVRPLLEAQGISVLMTRTDDKEVSINQRCAMANSAKCDYFLSLHRDAAAADAYGISVYVYSRADTRTVSLARGILDRALAVTPTKDRKVNKGSANPAWVDYGVNSGTTMASAMLELGFMTNAADNQRFDRYFDEYARAIAVGICDAFDVGYSDMEDVPKPDAPAIPPVPGNDYIYRVYEQIGAYANPDNAREAAKGKKAIVRYEPK